MPRKCLLWKHDGEEAEVSGLMLNVAFLTGDVNGVITVRVFVVVVIVVVCVVFTTCEPFTCAI